MATPRRGKRKRLAEDLDSLISPSVGESRVSQEQLLNDNISDISMHGSKSQVKNPQF